MKLIKSLLAVAIAGLAATGAHAAPYSGGFFTGSADGTISGLTGFDVFSNGATAFFCASAGGCGGGAIAAGAQLDPVALTPLAAGDIIHSVYQGVVSKFNPGLSTPLLFSPGSEPVGGYQLTVAASFYESVVFGFAFGGINPLAQASLAPLSANSRVSLFYDKVGQAGGGTLITQAAVAAGTGTGYTDGLLIADGTVDQFASLLGPVTVQDTNPGVGVSLEASGSSNIAGNFSSVAAGNAGTNTVGFIPVPGGFVSTTTLQYGPNTSGYQVSNFFDNANGWSSIAVIKSLTERADANIDLTAAVPEPASLALVGLALAGVGVATRRRKA